MTTHLTISPSFALFPPHMTQSLASNKNDQLENYGFILRFYNLLSNRDFVLTVWHIGSSINFYISQNVGKNNFQDIKLIITIPMA